MPSSELRTPARRSGRAPGLLLLALAAAMIPARTGNAAGLADFIVVEHADRLRAENRYQQDLSPSERASLAPFTPMRILREHDVLGDGFTPCLSVEAGGVPLYLLTSATGELLSIEPAGFQRIFRSTTPLADTIQVLESHALQLVSPSSPKSYQLLRGERLLRIFSMGTRVYAQLLTRDPMYGWLSLAGTRENREWERVASVAAPYWETPGQALHAIQARVDETNRILERLYAFFNGRTGQKKTAPQWAVVSSGNSIVCSLRNREPGADYSRSTRLLAKNLELAVLGKGLMVFALPDSIEIHPR